MLINRKVKLYKLIKILNITTFSLYNDNENFKSSVKPVAATIKKHAIA